MSHPDPYTDEWQSLYDETPIEVLEAEMEPYKNYLWYLATVYRQHPDGLDGAYNMAVSVTASLTGYYHNIYSPIVHWHPVSKEMHGVDPTANEPWYSLNTLMMRRCQGLIVWCSKNWRKSSGIKMEIDYFKSRKQEIRYYQEN